MLRYLLTLSVLSFCFLWPSFAVCATVLSFEDVSANTSIALVDYGGLQWDREGSSQGWGWSVWNTTNTLPYSGTNWLVNSHGKNFIGYTFPGTVYLNGAFFTKSSRHAEVDVDNPLANSAQMIRLYYYDSNLVEIGVSDWFSLDRYPTWFAAEQSVHRIVIEHDTLNTVDNSGKGVPDAEWFSTDHIVFNETPGFEPPPYCEIHDCNRDTVHVPSDEPTIQAGIDAVNEGGLVLVADGTYSGPGNFNIDFGGKRVTLRSEHGANHTIIDCQGSPERPRRAFNFISNEGPNTVVAGLGIIRGYSNINDHFDDYRGGAVYVHMASPTFRDCEFYDNRGHHGGVFYVTDTASPRIENCRFERNEAGDVGGVAMIRMYSNPTFWDCEMVGNRALHGGALNIYNSAPVIEKCLIANNVGLNKGGGLFLQDNASPDVIGCTIVGNGSALGGGIWAEQRGGRPGMTSPVFANCIVALNRAGGALENANAQPSFVCSDIFGNLGGDWTGYIAPQLGIEGNISADPLFCDSWDGSYFLSDRSPCTSLNSSCGVTIGYRDVGCSGPGPDLVNLVQWPVAQGGNGHWYAIEPVARYWRHAVVGANSLMQNDMHGYLATITSQAENDFIFNNVTAGVQTPTILNQFWLGARIVNGTWGWITREPFAYTNWSPGEPNNQNAETALGMWGHFTSHPLRVPGKWNNNLPDNTLNSLHQYWSIIEWGGAVADDIVETDQWINLYCEFPTLDSSLLEPGTIIDAFDPDGVRCGTAAVEPDGSYGFMLVYRDDPTTRRDEGAEPGDPIRLSINGHSVLSDPQVVWHENGDVLEICSFSSQISRQIHLREGWNLVSWNLDYSGPVGQAIAGFDQAIEIILGFDGAGLTYDPDLPQFSNLTHLDYHQGYWFKMKQPAVLAIGGQPVAPSDAISLREGWNLVSYWPDDPMPVELALTSVLPHLSLVYGYDRGVRVWTPGSGPFNTLSTLESIHGYWIKSDALANLVYPLYPDCTSYLGAGPVAAAKPEVPSPSRNWISLYGEDITLDGQTLSSGSAIEAVTETGEPCGRGVYNDGILRFTPVYGSDDLDPTTAAYPSEGDAIRLTIDGREVADEIIWISHGTRIRLAALRSVEAALDDLPDRFDLAQNYPNPFNPTTKIGFSLAEPSRVQLLVFNVMGQKVTTLVDDYLEAGSHSVVWDATEAASGVYLYRLETITFIETKKMVLLK